jgi:hypothetical protein
MKKYENCVILYNEAWTIFYSSEMVLIQVPEISSLCIRTLEQSVFLAATTASRSRVGDRSVVGEVPAPSYRRIAYDTWNMLPAKEKSQH